MSLQPPFFPYHPSIKFVKLADDTHDVPVGASKYTYKVPAKKVIIVQALLVTNSQLLQLQDAGGVLYDGQKMTDIVSTSSIGRFACNHLTHQWTTSPSDTTIPMIVRDKITIDFTSTAAGAGTALVQIYGFVIDDPRGLFSRESTYSRIT